MPVGNDNAITVSYGSFSVTLSGHEKPFELLTQITDYYSVLAQTNPNFGAMPMAPTSDITVETVSTPQPEQPPQHTETNEKKFVLEPEKTDNLWQEPIPEYHADPLVLQEPIPNQTTTADVMVSAADQALNAAQLPLEEKADTTPQKSKFLTNNYPFRHFPLRRPGRG
jgi:hypothetical protein